MLPFAESTSMGTKRKKIAFSAEGGDQKVFLSQVVETKSYMAVSSVH